MNETTIMDTRSRPREDPGGPESGTQRRVLKVEWTDVEWTKSDWFGDWLKGEGLTLVGGTLLTLLLFTIIRRSAQRWWLYFWMIAMPIFVFLFFVQPYVIDPIFDEFEPLSAKAPAHEVPSQ